MVDTIFVDQDTVVEADWLNDINDLNYTTYPAHVADYDAHVVTYDAHIANTSNPHSVTAAQLSLTIGTDTQAFDDTLTSIAALGTAADKLIYTTALDTWAETVLTSFIRTLLDDTTSSAARTTLDVYSQAEVDSLTGGDAAEAFTESLANLFHPDESKGLQEIQKAGGYPSSFNQQWGGMGFGLVLPDGTIGEAVTGCYDANAGNNPFADVASTAIRAQGFKVGKTTDIASVLSTIYKVGNPTNNLELYIYDDNSGEPNAVIANGAAIVQSGKLHSDKVPSGSVQFSFASAPNLIAGNQYYLVFKSSGATDSSNYWGWYRNTSKTYPHGHSYFGTAAEAWTAQATTTCDFAIIPATPTILNAGMNSNFAGSLHCYEGATLNQSGGFYFKNAELNHKFGTVLITGTGFTKDKTFYDSGLGTDSNRLVGRCNVTTGYAQWTLYENNETVHTVTGATDISTGDRCVAMRYRAEGDGSDVFYNYVDGASEGTPITGATITLDRAFEDGHTMLGGGFPLAPTFTDSQDMSALPSAGVYTWTGAATESNAFVVSGGIGYQNGAAYGATQAGYNEDASTSFVNATGGMIAYGNEVENTTNGIASAEFAVKYEDDVNVMNIYHHEYFIELNDGSNVGYIQWDGKQKTDFIFTAIGSDCYLYANNKLIFDGVGLFDSTGGTNKVAFGDFSTTSADNATGKWYYFDYYEGAYLPEYSDVQISELANWNKDASSLLSTIYNAGTPLSVKGLAGIGNYVKAVKQVIEVKGITSYPTLSTAYAPIDEMGVFCFGSRVRAHLENSTFISTANADMFIKINIDGVGYDAEAAICNQNATASKAHRLSSSSLRYVSAGLHFVNGVGRSSTGTFTSNAANRNMVVGVK